MNEDKCAPAKEGQPGAKGEFKAKASFCYAFTACFVSGTGAGAGG